MVAFAYIKPRGNNSDENGIWRWCLQADSSDTIDEWWREVSTQDKWGIERVSPDFYTAQKDVGRSIMESAPTLWKKIIFNQVHNWNNGSWIPTHVRERTDHVNGNCFYVRSKSNPQIFWYVDPEKGGTIIATKTGRTRFRFRMTDREAKTDKIMIGNDQVSIHCAAGQRLAVSVQGRTLFAGSGTGDFKFGDLQWRFQGEGPDNNSPVLETDNDDGEQWELVN